jgi:hypothetical protein
MNPYIAEIINETQQKKQYPNSPIETTTTAVPAEQTMEVEIPPIEKRLRTLSLPYPFFSNDYYTTTHVTPN